MSKELIESLFGLEEETKRFKVIEDVDEKTGTSRMKIQGVCQRADHVNLNNRVYPKKVIESALTGLSERISQGRGFGELDHPLQSPSLKNTAHLINNVWWDDADPSLLCCEVTVLDTPHGQVLKEIVRAGGRPGFSSRGSGDVERVKMGEREVDRILDGFSMASFDFVIDPSVQPAAIRKVMENAVQKYVTEGTMDIKSVDDLRMQFPDLVKEVEEKVIEDAEKVMAQELEEKNKQLAKELEDLKASMEDLKQKQVKEQEDEAGTKYVSFMNDLVDLLVEYGVLSSEAEAETDEPGTEEVPAGESKEVGMTDEEKRELENLKTVVTSLEDENKALKAKADEFDKAKAEAEAKAQEAEVQAEAEKKKSAELEEQQKVMSYIDEKLSGSKFATILKPRLEGCKTTEAVDEKMKAEESFIKSLEEQFGGQVPHAKGKTEMAGGDSEVQAIREKAKRVAGLTK